jgi:hypothetical protein
MSSNNTSEEFVAELRRLRASNGNPSLRELSRIADRRIAGGERTEPLPPSTTSEALAGKRLPRLPRLEFVESFVAACLIAGGASAGDPLVVEEVERWRSRWSALVTAADPSPPKRSGSVWLMVAAAAVGGFGAGLAAMRWVDTGQAPAPHAAVEAPAGDGCLASAAPGPVGRNVLPAPAWWANDAPSVRLTAREQGFAAVVSGGSMKPGDLLVVKSGVPLVLGRHYALAFTAAADRDSTILVRVQDNRPPIYYASFNRDVVVARRGCRYVYRFAGGKTSDHSELTFQVGGHPDDFRLQVSDVRLVEQGG